MNAYNDHTRMQSDELTYHHQHSPNGNSTGSGNGSPSSQRSLQVDLSTQPPPSLASSSLFDTSFVDGSNGGVVVGAGAADSLSSTSSSQPPPQLNGLLQHTTHGEHHHQPHHLVVDTNMASATQTTTTSSSSSAGGVGDLVAMSPDGGDIEEDAHASLTSQSLNTDGTPKRPMNAFMIFARRRRPQVSAANQTMRTGEISKILSREWNGMCMADKQFYLDQAKKLKENFNSRYPDYVYRRRPNNSRKRRRTGSVDSPYSRGSQDEGGLEDDIGIGTSTGGTGEDSPLDPQSGGAPLLSPLSANFDYTGGGGGRYGADFFDHHHHHHSSVSPTNTTSHHLPFPERFNQLAWPPLNHVSSSIPTNAPTTVPSSAPTKPPGPPRSQSLFGPEPVVESSTPWGSSSSITPTTSHNGPPKLDPLKIDTLSSSRWYLEQGHQSPILSHHHNHTHMPTRHRSMSHLSLDIKTEPLGPYTPALHTAPSVQSMSNNQQQQQQQGRPWSSSTSSGSSDSSQPPIQQPTVSPNPFDSPALGGTALGGGGGFYPSPTSAPAPAPVQSPNPSSSYFPSSSGGAGSGSLGHMYSSTGSGGVGGGGGGGHHSPTASPNYLPTPSSRTSLSYDPLSPRTYATATPFYGAPPPSHHHHHHHHAAHASHHHGLSTSHNPNDEPHRSATIGQDFPWDGKSD